MKGKKHRELKYSKFTFFRCIDDVKMYDIPDPVNGNVINFAGPAMEKSRYKELYIHKKLNQNDLCAMKHF